MWTVCSWYRGWKKCCPRYRWFSVDVRPSSRLRIVKPALPMRAPSLPSCSPPILTRRRQRRRKFRHFYWTDSLHAVCVQIMESNVLETETSVVDSRGNEFMFLAVWQFSPRVVSSIACKNFGDSLSLLMCSQITRTRWTSSSLWGICPPLPIQGLHAGSGVVRIDPLRLLARCCKRRLNQALCISLIIGFFVCVLLCCLLGPLFMCH